MIFDNLGMNRLHCTNGHETLFYSSGLKLHNCGVANEKGLMDMSLSNFTRHVVSHYLEGLLTRRSNLSLSPPLMMSCSSSVQMFSIRCIASSPTLNPELSSMWQFGRNLNSTSFAHWLECKAIRCDDATSYMRHLRSICQIVFT